MTRWRGLFEPFRMETLNTSQTTKAKPSKLAQVVMFASRPVRQFAPMALAA
jgi:hypothetical protein